MHKKNKYNDNCIKMNDDKKLKKWLEIYWKEFKFEVFKYFGEFDLKCLKRLNIYIVNKLYSEREIEILDMQIFQYYNNEKLLKEKNVSQKEYEKILQIMKKVIEENEL